MKKLRLISPILAEHWPCMSVFIRHFPILHVGIPRSAHARILASLEPEQLILLLF